MKKILLLLFTFLTINIYSQDNITNSRDISDDSRKISTTNSRDISDDSRKISTTNSREISNDSRKISTTNSRDISDDSRKISTTNSREISDDSRKISTTNSREISDDSRKISTTNSREISDDSRTIFNGYDGGMMLHLGYVSTNVKPLNYKAEGITKGIGGAIRFHFGEHYRIGTEGYVSTMSLMNNGSYMKTFWAGLLNDFYWRFGKLMPYVGLTIGGGALTDCFIFEGDNHDWEQETNVVINKNPFVAIDPIIGCDYCLTEAMHITVKFDCLFGFGSNDLYLPVGPRAYIGFIFFH